MKLVLAALSFIVCMYVEPIHAQSTYKVQLLNPNPTPEDTVSISVRELFSTLTYRIMQSHYRQGDSIFINACYLPSLATSLSSYNDTFNFGKLPPGDYTIFYIRHFTNRPDTCLPTRADTFRTSFNIPFPVVYYPLKQARILLYPNPTHSTQVLMLESLREYADFHVGLYDLSGRLISNIYEGPITHGLWQTTLDLGLLAHGCYLLRISGGDEVRVLKVVKY